MTREEAITNLNTISVAFVDVGTKEQRKLIDDTFERAIKALEQEPCEDCVSRKELLDATVKKNSIWNKITDSSGRNLSQIVVDLPSVTPKPNTDALDKITAEIERQEKWLMFSGYTAKDVDIAFGSIKSEISKYRAGYEGKTNGDIIKAMFPKTTVYISYPRVEDDEVFCIYIDDGERESITMRALKSWWEAPYKTGGKNNE